jgi:hypothetical protein
MKILLFSEREDVISAFRKAMGRSSHTLETCNHSDLNKKLKDCSREDLQYVDVAGLSDDRMKRTLKRLSTLDYCTYGVVDPDGRIADIGGLFHDGAVDYLGEETLPTLKSARFKRAAGFRPPRHEPEVERPPVPASKNYILSGSDWSGVRPGKEYTFFLLYVKLDQYESIKEKQGDDLTNRLIEKFRAYIESALTAAGGRLWMWNESGGVFLFPFDGQSYAPVVSCIRIMLARRIFNVEVIGSTILFSYRIALDVGNTTYQERGRTGHIISDSVNFIHHLGQRRLEEGSFFVTGELHTMLPDALKETFSPVDRYEGRHILRFNQPLHL